MPNLNTKKIVITGGPGTGKSSIVNELMRRDFHCFEEISRAVILKAREDGIEQLFLTDPLKFSELLLHGRIDQFRSADALDKPQVFIDRGIPDVLAYMDYIGDSYPQYFVDACQEHIYDQVFILAPWQEIFRSDNERYENFEQAIRIHEYLLKTYDHFNYKLLDVPFGPVKNRADFILNAMLTK